MDKLELLRRSAKAVGHCDPVKPATLPVEPMIIFQKHYDGESIVDVSRDVWEAFDADFNPVMGTIPLNQWNMHQGTFRVTVEWEPGQ